MNKADTKKLRRTIKSYMWIHVDEYLDSAGCVNMTSLAEAAMDEFNLVDEYGNILNQDAADSDTGWIWDVACEVADMHEDR